MYEEIVKKLLSFPQKGQIEIDFDLKTKTFRLSSPIFSSRTMPDCIKNYVESRKGLTFKPHVTSFQLNAGKVFLIQEIPFELKFQDSLRSQIDRFLQMSKKCNQMLSEMAVEEKYKEALHLDSHFSE